jgi:uncharacterized protein YdaU (DUF1376 family)
LNYYQFHLGDFHGATKHLTRAERGVYRDLLDLYYQTEAALPADIKTTARLACCADAPALVEAILREFFVMSEDGWRNMRCDKEIQRVQEWLAKSARGGKASAAARQRGKFSIVKGG